MQELQRRKAQCVFEADTLPATAEELGDRPDAVPAAVDPYYPSLEAWQGGPCLLSPRGL